MQDIFKSKSSKGLGLSVMEREERGTAILFNPVNYNVTLLRLSKRKNRDESRVLLCEEEECESAEGFYPTLSPKVRPGP